MDYLSEREGVFTSTVIDHLKLQSWAKPLIRDVTANGGVTAGNKAHLFECRFAYALTVSGIQPAYEVPGENLSSIDFGFRSSGQGWMVEMMSLAESTAARSATISSSDKGGTSWSQLFYSSNHTSQKQSVEGETLKAIQRICQKCEKNGKPHKFPLPNGNLHALLIDLRMFLHGGDFHDRIHIGLGGEYVADEYKMYWNDVLISGVFDPGTRLKGAAEIRERVHFLGFVDEEGKFSEGAFGGAIQFVANPNLFGNQQEMQQAIGSWPLQPVRVINGGGQ